MICMMQSQTRSGESERSFPIDKRFQANEFRRTRKLYDKTSRSETDNMVKRTYEEVCPVGALS